MDFEKALNKRLEEREELAIIAAEEMAIVKSQTPLHMLIEREQKNKEGSLLEERKKKLADIRSFYKPIDREAMQKHIRDYSTTKK